MIKKLIIGFLLLAVIAAAAVFFLGSSALNKGIQSGVETYGPRVTQTPVTLGAANISFLSGSGTLTNLLVGNPDGFKSEHIFALNEISVKVDTSTLLSDKIVIDHIIIQKPKISYEPSLQGSNVKRLMENIEAFTGPKDATATAPETKTSPGKQVVIRKLIIEEATVYVGLMGVGQTVSIPRIEMDNIGEEGQRLTVAEVIDLVLTKVVQSIGSAIKGAGNLLREGGQSVLNTTTREAREHLDGAVGGAGDAVNKASERIKGLFGN